MASCADRHLGSRLEEPAPVRELEVGVHDLPVAARLLHAAGRLLEQGDARGHDVERADVLRPDQLPVFRSFSDWLVDVATRPSLEAVPPHGRIVLPPRTGKTVVAAHIIDRTDLTAVFVVPTQALVDQTIGEITAHVPGVTVGEYWGDEKCVVERGVNVTTYASLVGLVKRREVPGAFRRSALVFVDEAHHVMTKRRLDALSGAFDRSAARIALTATPDYGDGRALGHCFPDLVHEIMLSEALSMGLLAPVRVWVAEVDTDASEVRFVSGDFEAGTLGRLLSTAPFFRSLEVLRYAPENRETPCMIACASRQQAYDAWQYLRKHRPDGAPAPALILGDTPAERRRMALARFDAGRIDTLVQVGVLIEGWSSPRCKLLIDLAPTASQVRATQKYFRVMTRDGESEASIYVLLPRRLPAPPVLPMDLLLPAGSEVLAGALIGEAPGGTGVRPLEQHRQTLVAGVRLVHRVFACGHLTRPALDPSDPDQVRTVLESCPDFDPSSPPTGPHALRRLVFRHPLFTGTGAALLRWLGVPETRVDVLELLGRLYSDATGMAILVEGAGYDGEVRCSCQEDARAFEIELFGPSSEGGRPEEPFPSTLRALSGIPPEPPSPEDVVLFRERLAMLPRLLLAQTERRRLATVFHAGLVTFSDPTYDEIGAMLHVCRERARSIEGQGHKRIARQVRAEELAEQREIGVREMAAQRRAAQRVESIDLSVTCSSGRCTSRTGRG